MPSLPLPVRVTAGLVATAVEQTRQLPNQLFGLPVTVVSQALQVSMRVQQQITELAIRGDEALNGCRTPEDQPSWATFDEDDPPVATPSPRGPGPAWDRAPDEKPEAVTEELSALPDYDHLTLPQLRGKLRGFTAADLAELLNYELSHAQRPEFVRMLSNRLERVRSPE